MQLKLEPWEEGFNNILNKINDFGKIIFDNGEYFSFKEYPKNINENRKYIVSGEKRNIITKTGKDGECLGTICEN